MKREPAYLTVYNKLKNEIRDNEYCAGEYLPVESELERIFGVSRTTVRRAIEMLARDGYVYVKQGRGTEVLDFAASHSLNRVTSFSSTLRARGIAVRSKSIFIDEIKASASTANDLQVEKDSPIIQIQRLQLADETPIAIIKNYIAKDMVPGFLDKVTKLESVYRFLEEEYGIVLTSTRDIIFAKPADFNESGLLGIENSSPLLCMRRVTFSNEKPVTIDRLHIRYDKYVMQANSTQLN